MKKLVTSLLKSIPELISVVAFLSFLFYLYGLIGVQLWSGVLHSRCRLTPYPLRLESSISFSAFPAYQDKVIQNYTEMACKDDQDIQIPLSKDSWSHDTSPWKIPRVCFWPIAVEATKQVCSLDGISYRQCPIGQVRLAFPSSAHTSTCSLSSVLDMWVRL